MRTTMDIDANITGMNFEISQIQEMVKNILSIELNDNVKFDLENLIPIKEDNEYGGYKFKITGTQSNVKVPFSIDISTGDIITPRAIEYKYKTILENEYINLYTYNYETIIAEKLETILKRNVANSRMKDYYDIYYFAYKKWNDIDKDTLKQAINTTFNHRDSQYELDNYKVIINQLRGSEYLKKLWEAYKSKHDYAKNILYEDVINAVEMILGDKH